MSYTTPDPRVYQKAAGKVIAGANPSDALFGAVHELYPESTGPNFNPEAFNWKILHWEQYKAAFGEIAQPTFKVDRSKLPTKVRHAQVLIDAMSFELMSAICTNPEEAAPEPAAPEVVTTTTLKAAPKAARKTSWKAIQGVKQ